MGKTLLEKILRLGLLMCLTAVTAVGGELQPFNTAESLALHREFDTQAHHETEVDLSVGYRWLNLDDFTRAGEYQYPHSSFAGSINLDSYPLPHRFHLYSEFLGANNYYGDMGYAYHDLLLFRDIFTGSYHNLDHYDYQQTGAAGINYNDKNPDDLYGTEVYDNILSLRLKAPDFPFHTFLTHRYIQKDGAIQQRYLIGTFGNINKTSSSREIDWRTTDLTLGFNSHLGPLEVEVAHERTEFDPGRNNVLYDAYPIQSTRPADTYPHDVIPETESSLNSVKLHTSYTGGFVASASLSHGNQKNNYSGAQSDTLHGAMDLIWIPAPDLNLFLKYRHQELET
ncbi:MAG: hypothetical protein KKE17_15605, partial [Proteobacteria bacterium]|nr:hypothetical protein [Pseudomonadota bacterium]